MRFIVKRDSWDRDWIARATADVHMREARFAAAPELHDPLEVPYLGASHDGDGVAILMRDLSGILFDWERPLDAAALDRVLDELAAFHVAAWESLRSHPSLSLRLPAACPLDLRLLLLSPVAAKRYARQGLPVGGVFGRGWAAFRRLAPVEAVDLVERLSADVRPLVDALGRLPWTHLHGDLKLSNVGFSARGDLIVIDWQMSTEAPVAVEFGWFLVSNSAVLPSPPDVVFERYILALERADLHRAAHDLVRPDSATLVGDRQLQADLTWIVGLLLRGWRKGLDAEAGTTLASGVSAAEDLRWWCEHAVAAASRRLVP